MGGVQPLENLLVARFGVIGARVRWGHRGEGAERQKQGGDRRAAGFRQAREGAVHEEHDQAIGDQHHEGGDEQRRAQRFRGFADQGFVCRADTGSGCVERAQRRTCGQEIESHEAILCAIKAGGIVETGAGRLVSTHFKRAGGADFGGHRTFGRQ